MSKQVETTITCDVCGEEIQGDYLLIRVQWGLRSIAYYVHNPRTAAIIPCGNQTLEKLDEHFRYAGSIT